MSFNRLLEHIAKLVKSDDPVASDIPCKSEILGLRECAKGDSKECTGLALDLMNCVAQYRVDTTAKLRKTIGIAQYNEYVKELDTKYGKEKAESIIAEPTEQLQSVQAAQLLYRLSTNAHPQGAPKTEADLQNWTHADQVRLEMGEQAYWDSVKVVGQEFGADPVQRLFGVNEEFAQVSEAYKRVTGSDIKKEMSQALDKLNSVMGPVRETAPEAKSVEDIAAAFKKTYPTEADLKAAF